MGINTVVGATMFGIGMVFIPIIILAGDPLRTKFIVKYNRVKLSM